MKTVCKFMALLLVGALVFQPLLAVAGPGARLIPNGNVSLLKDGNEVTQFKSEMPLPDGLLMVSKGSCVVQSSGLQFVAQDQAVFGLSESFDRWNVTIKSGRVDFAMRGDAKLVTFNTPHDTIRTDSFIVPASSDGLVKGYILVSDAGTELRMDDGGLQLATAEGAQTVQAPGQIVLASMKTSEAVTSGADSPMVGSGQDAVPWTWVLGGVLAAGALAGGIYWATSGDDDDDDDWDRRGGIFFHNGRPRLLPALVLGYLIFHERSRFRPGGGGGLPGPGLPPGALLFVLNYLRTHGLPDLPGRS